MAFVRVRPLALAVAVLALACSAPQRADDPTGTASCGNGVLEPGETCDRTITSGAGACPTSCPAGDVCAPTLLTGTAAACTAACTPIPVTLCRNDDGCCATGCTPQNDSDCSGTCGNGVRDGDETCDGDCPTSCDDFDVCTTDRLTGSAAACSARCTNVAITACRNGDGCCPNGCTHANDTDCGGSLCGNGRIDSGEACDGNCPTSCDDFNSCTTDRLTGSAATCSARCTNVAVTACVSGDGCCPASCTGTSDSDCGGSLCGNGRIDPGESCDGNCPTSCDDANACTTDTTTGSAATCDVACGHQAVTQCQHNDGCCPSGCTSANDNDCTVTCSPTCATGQRCVNGACSGSPVPIGAACTDAAGCEGGSCDDQDTTGWPGGYCSKSCQSQTDCPSGSSCQSGACYKPCSLSSECRTGYECYARYTTATKVCGPAGRGSSPVGGPCTTIADCNGGQAAGCYTQAGTDTKGGYCTMSCSAQSPCPTGSHCGNLTNSVGTCLKDCSPSNPCLRGAGYGCWDKNADGTNECWLSATGSGLPGAACAGPWECGGGIYGQCIDGTAAFLTLSSWPGGYCSIACNAGQGTCPGNSVCDTRNLLDLFSGDHYCMEGCSGAGTNCRAGYTCKAGDLFGGVLACRP